jgi:hypothetical protein
VAFNSEVSLLIYFCLNDLSIGDMGILKSPTIIVLGYICSFKCSTVCLIKLGKIHLAHIYQQLLFPLDWLLPLLILTDLFCFFWLILVWSLFYQIHFISYTFGVVHLLRKFFTLTYGVFKKIFWHCDAFLISIKCSCSAF